MPFNGFISYSHAADNRLAPAVQHGLHQLAKPWHRRRALWIFRDQTGLAVTPALWSSIQNALDGSDFFVLLASPEAARSSWVNREIEHWMANKSATKILPVVTDGEWRWDPWTRDFSEDSTAVPAALRGAFTEEPLYLDLRWARDDRHLSLRHSRFRDAIAQLAAPMHGVSKDDLEGEDVRQHRRARRLQVGALSALVLLTFVAVLTGLMALRNADRATASAHEALRQQRAALVQQTNAQRFAGEARKQGDLAQQEQTRAHDAALETERQVALAREQKALAVQASVEAGKQEELAKTQKSLAAQARKDAAKEQKNAAQQRQLADRAAARAKQQEALAAAQRDLATRWAAEAEREQKLAEKAAAAAEQQTRVAVGRKLINRAKATVGEDPRTALMLGTAADKIQNDEESRRELAGLVTSTRYAGTIDGATAITAGAGDVVAARTDGGVVSLWNVADRARPAKLATLGGTAKFVAFSPDGKIVAVAPDGGAVTLWNVATPAHPVRLGDVPGLNYVHALAFSIDGRTLAASVYGFLARPDDPEHLNDVAFVDVSDPSHPEALSTVATAESVEQIAYSPDGHTVVLRADTAAVYDVTIPAHPHPDLGFGQWNVQAMAFSPDRPTLATVEDTDGTVNLWDVTDPTSLLKTGSLKAPNWVSALSFQPGGSTLVTAGLDGQARLWDVTDPAAPVAVGEAGSRDPVRAMAYDSGGRTLITTGGDAATLWTTADRGAPQSVAELINHNGYQRASVFGPDGKSLTTVDVHGTVTVWDVSRPDRPAHRGSFGVHDALIYAAAFSADRRTVATGGEDDRLTLTDVSNPGRPVPLADVAVELGDNREPQRFQTMTFSTDGHTLAVATTYGQVLLYDLTDRRHPRLVSTTRFAAFTALAFSPDGHTLASSDGSGRVEMWDVTRPAAPIRLTTMTNRRSMSDAAPVSFSPDGNTLVAGGSTDKTVTLWDVTDRSHPSRVATVAGHDAAVTAAAISTDGRTLATGSNDHVVLLWDITDRSNPIRVATLQRPSLAGTIAFSPDAKTLATGFTGTSANLTLWDYSALNHVRTASAGTACAMTGRGFTADEWARAIPEVKYQRTCTG